MLWANGCHNCIVTTWRGIILLFCCTLPAVLIQRCIWPYVCSLYRGSYVVHTSIAVTYPSLPFLFLPCSPSPSPFLLLCLHCSPSSPPHTVRSLLCPPHYCQQLQGRLVSPESHRSTRCKQCATFEGIVTCGQGGCLRVSGELITCTNTYPSPSQCQLLTVCHILSTVLYTTVYNVVYLT